MFVMAVRVWQIQVMAVGVQVEAGHESKRGRKKRMKGVWLKMVSMVRSTQQQEKQERAVMSVGLVMKCVMLIKVNIVKIFALLTRKKIIIIMCIILVLDIFSAKQCTCILMHYIFYTPNT